MKDMCHKCGKEYELRSEANVSGLCDACQFSEEPIVRPYSPNPRDNPRKAYIRERDLANGSHIRLSRFLEPGSEGDCGINLVYLSPIKDGKRTELKFALSDEAAAETCMMLAEFFGIGWCA